MILGVMMMSAFLSGEMCQYEQILMTRLRDKNTSTREFRVTVEKLAGLLISKVVEGLPTRPVSVETPLTLTSGLEFCSSLEIVSIMRSGDALVDPFITHFPEARVSKFLIQRDEESAKPHFKYQKVSPTLAAGGPVVIVEPMLATGGTLDMTITMLKALGVKEENLTIASICAAPEGLHLLNEKYPQVKVVYIVLDEKLNEKKYIVPGIGDFGDRYFGTSGS